MSPVPSPHSLLQGEILALFLRQGHRSGDSSGDAASDALAIHGGKIW